MVAVGVFGPLSEATMVEVMAKRRKRKKSRRPSPAVAYTATEQRMLDVLADGALHDREELRACLWDDHGAASNIQPHLSAIRRKIRPKCDIACILLGGAIKYQLVCLGSTLSRKPT
jgi:hypothetical protein